MAVERIGSMVEEITTEDKAVDREKTCPLLLRVFCANGRHNAVAEYLRANVPPNELQIYTWMDCCLRELTGLIKEVNPDARRKGTFYDFAVVSPNPRGGFNIREIGTTCSGQRGVDDAKTLQQCKFEIGDYMDVAITLPGFNRPTPARGGYGGDQRGWGGEQRGRDGWGGEQRGWGGDQRGRDREGGWRGDRGGRF